MNGSTSAWQQVLPQIIPADQHALPDGGSTAEAIVAMADEWHGIGGRLRLSPMYRPAGAVRITDDFQRRFPLAEDERADYESGREPAICHLLNRLALHAFSRSTDTEPTRMTALSLGGSEHLWVAYTAAGDAAALTLAALDVQLTGDPRLALWYLNSTPCPDDCLYHAPPPQDGGWRMPLRTASEPLVWASLPRLVWRPGTAVAGRLDPDLPDARPHPFFADRRRALNVINQDDTPTAA